MIVPSLPGRCEVDWRSRLRLENLDFNSVTTDSHGEDWGPPIHAIAARVKIGNPHGFEMRLGRSSELGLCLFSDFGFQRLQEYRARQTVYEEGI